MGFSWEYDRARAQCRIWGLPLLQLELDVRFYRDIQNTSKTFVDTYIYIYTHRESWVTIWGLEFWVCVLGMRKVGCTVQRGVLGSRRGGGLGLV